MLAGTAFSDPIHDAAMYGNLAGVQAELDKGVDVNTKNYFGETPLDMTLWLNDESKTADLIRNHGGKTSKELIALSDAVRTGNIEDVKKHLSAGTDVNVKGGFADGTPLHYAAANGHKEIAELLIEKGADVKAKDEGGKTPLDVAIQFKELEIANLIRVIGGKTGEELKAEGK